MQLPPQYPSEQVRYLPARSAEEYRAAGAKYLVAASADFQATLVDPNANAEAFASYRRLLADAAEVAAFAPASGVSGPRLRIFQLVK